MIGELAYFLGMQVKQTSEGIFISQAKYAKDLVKRFGLDGKSYACTPMSTNVKISVDLTSKQVDPTLYRSMIGSLFYLTASRLDIAFSVGVCARFQANPKESHHQVRNLVLAGYFDANWAGNADERKSTSGGCFYVGTNLVAWMSRKQTSISLSTAEACYYGFTQDTMVIHSNNTSAINISKNPVQHSRTKHINIQHHFICDLVESREVALMFIPTENQLADILTKPLDGSRLP